MDDIEEAFDYNRENYQHDAKLWMEREYQEQKMRLDQGALYRDDVRDLMELTCSKMDLYLIVDALFLDGAVTILCKGHIDGAPSWLTWLHYISLCSAFLLFFLSLWLAMHASVAAHSFAVRLLTQYVRLPIPSEEQLDAVRPLAAEFEGNAPSDMLRIPVLKVAAKKLEASMAKEATGGANEEDKLTELQRARQDYLNSLPQNERIEVTSLEHVRLYRRMQSNFISYDAYARAGTSLGLNSVLFSLWYFCLGLTTVEAGESQEYAAWGCALIMAANVLLVSKLDFDLGGKQFWITSFLVCMPCACSAAACNFYRNGNMKLYIYFVFLVFFFHVCWTMMILSLVKADADTKVKLPNSFKQVLYLDVFGENNPLRKLDEMAIRDSIQKKFLEAYLSIIAYKRLMHLVDLPDPVLELVDAYQSIAGHILEPLWDSKLLPCMLVKESASVNSMSINAEKPYIFVDNIRAQKEGGKQYFLDPHTEQTIEPLQGERVVLPLFILRALLEQITNISPTRNAKTNSSQNANKNTNENVKESNDVLVNENPNGEMNTTNGGKAPENVEFTTTTMPRMLYGSASVIEGFRASASTEHLITASVLEANARDSVDDDSVAVVPDSIDSSGVGMGGELIGEAGSGEGPSEGDNSSSKAASNVKSVGRTKLEAQARSNAFYNPPSETNEGTLFQQSSRAFQKNMTKILTMGRCAIFGDTRPVTVEQSRAAFQSAANSTTDVFTPRTPGYTPRVQRQMAIHERLIHFAAADRSRTAVGRERDRIQQSQEPIFDGRAVNKGYLRLQDNTLESTTAFFPINQFDKSSRPKTSITESPTTAHGKDWLVPLVRQGDVPLSSSTGDQRGHAGRRPIVEPLLVDETMGIIDEADAQQRQNLQRMRARNSWWARRGLNRLRCWRRNKRRLCADRMMPGALPWFMFLVAMSLFLFLWILGFVWFLFHITDKDILIERVEETNRWVKDTVSNKPQLNQPQKLETFSMRGDRLQAVSEHSEHHHSGTGMTNVRLHRSSAITPSNSTERIYRIKLDSMGRLVDSETNAVLLSLPQQVSGTRKTKKVYSRKTDIPNSLPTKVPFMSAMPKPQKRTDTDIGRNAIIDFKIVCDDSPEDDRRKRGNCNLLLITSDELRSYNVTAQQATGKLSTSLFQSFSVKHATSLYVTDGVLHVLSNANNRFAIDSNFSENSIGRFGGASSGCDKRSTKGWRKKCRRKYDRYPRRNSKKTSGFSITQYRLGSDSNGTQLVPIDSFSLNSRCEVSAGLSSGSPLLSDDHIERRLLHYTDRHHNRGMFSSLVRMLSGGSGYGQGVMNSMGIGSDSRQVTANVVSKKDGTSLRTSEDLFCFQRSDTQMIVASDRVLGIRDAIG